jgi:predicted N-acetyltransferase YhbS
MQLEIHHLTSDDISWAMQLVECANWNQTPNDWRRVLENQAGGSFKAVANDVSVGTVTTTRYGSQLAWIGMMLVHPDYRRKGAGITLMQQALEHLHQFQTSTIKLDATPVGRPLYERLGFRAEWDFERWQRPPSPKVLKLEQSKHHDKHTCGVQEQLQRLRNLDMRAFGVDRISFLARVAEDSRCVFREHGFGMLRPGRIGSYLGPIVSEKHSITESIIAELLQEIEGSVIWDIFPHDPANKQLAQALGFQPVRSLTRMVLGDELIVPQLALQAALCDPATG